MKVKVLSGQSLTDIAIQIYGNVEGVFMLAQENGLSVTDELEPGQMLSYSPDKIINKKVVCHYAVNGIFPTTLFTGDWRIFDSSFDFTFE